MLIDRMQKLFALWIKIVVAGVACCMVIPESLHAQRSPRFDYFFLEASSCMRADDMASASELFQHCLEIDSTAAEALYSAGLMEMFLLETEPLTVSSSTWRMPGFAARKARYSL